LLHTTCSTSRVRLGVRHHASLIKHTITDGKGKWTSRPSLSLVIAAYPAETSWFWWMKILVLDTPDALQTFVMRMLDWDPNPQPCGAPASA
jgi:hypothetical protein